MPRYEWKVHEEARLVSRPRVDEKGGKNQFPRSGQLAAIHLPSHDLEISGISKERRICVQKTDGFTPLRPSLAFNPLFQQSPLFFLLFFFSTLNRFFYLTFSRFFPSFLPSSSVFFFFVSFAVKRLPPKFPEKFSEHAGYASSASPFDFIPPPASAARWSSEIRKKFTCLLPRHFARGRLFPRLSFSVSCGFKASRYEGRK